LGRHCLILLPAVASRVQLYLVVDDAAAYRARVRAAGAAELSQLARRSWGDDVAYCLDPDGHVVAFCR